MSRDTITAVEAEYEPETDEPKPESSSHRGTCVHGSLACM